MRKELCDALVSRAQNSPDMVFLTGDLGFMALEPLRDLMGPRFINAGVAEQNMISVAAALAREGMDVWAYSIAPFCYARPFEQIRNDVAFHKLPVKLIGNGGGYGYGVMGATHHAIEDYGVLLTLPNMTALVPVFNEDVGPVIERGGACKGPVYIRLGRGELPAGFAYPEYSAWRQIVHGDGPTLICVGPLAGTYIAELQALDKNIRPNCWVLSELPQHISSIPEEIMTQLIRYPALIVAEEHVAHGSFASSFLMALAEAGIPLMRFEHLCARAHHYDRYGSQAYLRQQSGIASSHLLDAIKRITAQIET